MFRRARAKRLGATCALLTAFGLATAEPALTADDLVPIPPVPVALDVGVGGSDGSSADAEQASSNSPLATDVTPAVPPVSIAVETEAGNIDVSVRVFSPGVDGSTGSKGAEPPLVSSAALPDITADADSAPDADTALDLPASGSNVNVEVGLLSPGDNAPVVQSTLPEDMEGPAVAGDTTLDASSADELDPAAASSSTSSESAEPPLTLLETREQYQEDDSRYQSTEQFAEDPWYWLWHLSVGCDGSTTSTSTETGHESSSDWVWKWAWEWSCNSPSHPPPLELGRVRADSGADTALAAPEGSDTSPEPWRWTWTFTFCGNTTSAAIPVQVSTDLLWDWEWTWNWTCESGTTEPAGASEPTPPAASSTGAASEAAGSAPMATDTSTDQLGAVLTSAALMPVWFPVWVGQQFPFAELASVAPTRLLLPLDSFEIATISAIPELGVLATPLLPVVPLPPDITGGTTFGVESTVISPSTLHEHGRTSTTRVGIEIQVAAIGATGARPRTTPDEARAASKPRHHSAAPRTSHAPLSPLQPKRPMQTAGGVSGASGNSVPSGSVFGVAALIAFFVLAAPGLGRRMRVARELRPRGTYGSSIDRPG